MKRAEKAQKIREEVEQLLTPEQLQYVDFRKDPKKRWMR